MKNQPRFDLKIDSIVQRNPHYRTGKGRYKLDVARGRTRRAQFDVEDSEELAESSTEVEDSEDEEIESDDQSVSERVNHRAPRSSQVTLVATQSFVIPSFPRPVKRKRPTSTSRVGQVTGNSSKSVKSHPPRRPQWKRKLLDSRDATVERLPDIKEVVQEREQNEVEDALFGNTLDSTGPPSAIFLTPRAIPPRVVPSKRPVYLARSLLRELTAERDLYSKQSH